MEGQGIQLADIMEEYKSSSRTFTFTDYYFYLIAAETERKETIPKYYRIDRIASIREHKDVRFHGNPAAFDEEQLRKKSLLMWPGPESFVSEMKEEIRKINRLYGLQAEKGTVEHGEDKAEQ